MSKTDSSMSRSMEEVDFIFMFSYSFKGVVFCIDYVFKAIFFRLYDDFWGRVIEHLAH